MSDTKKLKQSDIIAVKLEDLKQTVADGQAQIRSDVAVLRQSVDSFRTEVPAIVASQVTGQLNTYANQHAALHTQLEAERVKDTQRFWAVVGFIMTVITIFLGFIGSQLVTGNWPAAMPFLAATVVTGSSSVVIALKTKAVLSAVVAAPVLFVKARFRK